jgi:hypothetical protein
MSLNKKKINTILNFILLLVLAYFIYYQYNKTHNLDTFDDSKFSKTCTMNINDLDHRTLDDYNTFDGKTINCGPCNGAILKMNINTCAKDENGSPVAGCSPNGPVANIEKVTTVNKMVYNENVYFSTKASPGNIKTFFCFE